MSILWQLFSNICNNATNNIIAMNCNRLHTKWVGCLFTLKTKYFKAKKKIKKMKYLGVLRGKFNLIYICTKSINHCK